MSEYRPKKGAPRLPVKLGLGEALDSCCNHKVAYLAVSKGMVRFFEGDYTAIFLSYLHNHFSEWYKKGWLSEDGFLQCSIEYARHGCGLSRKRQDRALDILSELGLIEKKVVGIETKRWLKLNAIDYDFLCKLMADADYAYDISYKTLEKYGRGTAVWMLENNLQKCIDEQQVSNSTNVQKGQSRMSELDNHECPEGATKEHTGKEHTGKEQSESTTTGSCRDEGQNPPSSGHSYSANHLAVNQALNATRSNTNTPANSRQRKPRCPPAPLPSHPAIPFMQELARTLAPVLATSSHAEYPSEGATAFKYHTDALEAYDAIQTNSIMARPLDRPERYLDPTVWGNDFRLAQLRQWAKDPKAMEAALLSAARIFATYRAKNTTVAKLPTVAAFLFGSTTSGGFLPWWSAIKPVEAMEAKEKKILEKAELEESSKPRWLELEEKNRIEQNSFEHRHFKKLFGREPKQFKETK